MQSKLETPRKKDNLIDSATFWRNFLKGFSAPTVLAIDRVSLRPEGGAVEYQEQVLSLRGLEAQQIPFNGLEIGTLLQGLWALLLSRYSGESDVVFGVQAGDRSLPMRVTVDSERLLSPWLQQLAEQWASLQVYRNTPWEQIRAASDVPHETLLFQSLLVLPDTFDDVDPERKITSDQLPFANYPLILLGSVDPELRLRIRYDRHCFDDATITRMLGHLETLLAGMVNCLDANSEQRLADIPWLTAAERHQLLEEWNNTTVDYPKDKCIHQVFEEQVDRTPDAIAIVLPAANSHPEQQLTYRELNDRSNYLADHLQKLGVGTETFVAIMMDRSIEMMVGILGILKAGGVYVPLDPAYPPERLAFMLDDSQATVLLTQSHLVQRLPHHSAQVICLDTGWGSDAPLMSVPPVVEVNSDNLAYINYTSGSTGTPKGVTIPHRAVLRLVSGATYTRLDAHQTFLQLAPISFDAATLEIWGALLHGGRCVLFPDNGLPDPHDLGKIIRQYQVTTLWLTAAFFNAIVMAAPSALETVQEILTGGEALSMFHIRRAQELLPNTQLINGYGPTESTTFTCCYRIPRELDDRLTSIPIGRPIANTQIYILDTQLQPMPVGVSGELYIGGDGLARGYLNRSDLTQERFIPHPFSANSETRLYRTGDMVRYLPDGNVEFVGRTDNQVKIRGYRIELGEIETVLSQHDAVCDAVVMVREDLPGDRRLAAYLTVNVDRPLLRIDQIQDYLRKRLAAYMVPSDLVVLDNIPLTPNGKVDRRALPKPIAEIHENFVAPNTPIERGLAEIWGDILGLSLVGIEDSFFDLGGTSILILQVVARIQRNFGIQLRAVKLYQHPTIRALAKHLVQLQTPQQSVQESVQQSVSNLQAARSSTDSDGIAIIGMVGRFPGANTVADLWQNLCAGVESGTHFTIDEIDPSVNPELRDDPNYVRVRGIIEGAETFDAEFFGISPREAEVMDPQARVFLELAYEALETVGYTPEQFPGQIGLYAGSGQNTYFERHICGRPEIIDRLGAFQTMLANEKDFLTTRTSYKLNLTGPSLSINTACSTSLVAVIQAFQGLTTHQCDVALAGGVSITTPQNTGYLYQEGGMLSSDGRCRPFDAEAQGTMFNNGAGIVVLKRLSDAIAAGDRIYAVVKGVGLNNDGADKVSFTAPSVNGQLAAITKAHASAGCSPDTISYVETHGTATPLGDPIELEALTQAFQLTTNSESVCATGSIAIGSIKSNIGHAVSAAGVAGLMKTALSLYHEQIPPSLNFAAPNPALDLGQTPFYVNTELMDWPIGATGATPRRAGVSSFGVGGTNAHVVLEEAPIVQASSPSRPYQLLVLSAKNSEALDRATVNLATHLAETPDINLADVAYTLQLGRKGFNHRRVVVCQDGDAAIAHLTTLDPKFTATRHTQVRSPDVVFMFPGQGSQYINMGLNLYQHEFVFSAAIDRCAEILKPWLNQDLRDIIYPAAGDGEAAATALRQTVYTQPALFAIEYALAQLWISWGVRPAAMIGHSIGEFVAACVAGVFSLEDGLKLVATRGRMMWDLPAGSMLSVLSPAATIAMRLTGDLAIAAINGPSLCVVSGPTDAVALLQTELESEGIICRPLHTSHAFHSPMMAPIVAPFADMVKTVTLSAPKIPFVSTVTADWITDAQALDPLYWASHLQATVRFADGVKTLWQRPDRVLLEVGPRTTTTTLARQQAQDIKRQIAIASLGSTAEGNAEWLSVLQAIGQLWLAGVTPDWSAFYADEYRHRIPLPTYPFARQRYWIDPKPFHSPSVESVVPTVELSQNSVILEPLTAPPLSPSSQAVASPPLASPPIMIETRKQRLIPLIKTVIETTSGLDVTSLDEIVTFLEIGLDSLTLTQLAIALKKQFKVKITFRHLLEDYPNLGTLAEFLDQSLPADAFPPATPAAATAIPTIAAPIPSTPVEMTMSVPSPSHSMNGYGTPGAVAASMVSNPESTSAIAALVAQQLQIMTQQLHLLGQPGVAQPTLPQPTPTLLAATPALLSVVPAPVPAPVSPIPSTAASQPKKAFGPGAKIEKSSTIITPEQQAALDGIIARYTTRTAESKRQTQEHRRYLADPRTVSGFTPLLKELVYPIVTDRASGSKLWDVDGNEYVDLTNGFGLNFFGWSPDFVTAAIQAQLAKGIEIGPQTPLAGRVAKMITEFIGMERVAFCNTGSEAVMAAMRLARTVTGRSTIAIFAGSYHGTFDEVIVRSGPNLRSLPAAPGIMPSMFENLLVLDYGTPESLQILRDRADDLAAIMVEPVQSRRPELQPKEFLQALRQLTEESGTALIFDEVVTGFRVHPGGAQAYFGIQADLATYGKVVGGGLPIGVVAGKAEYLDALDGGFWEFGDQSFPEVGVTFFAGTFVRHPMALAAAEAVLTRLKAAGPELQQGLAEKVDRCVTHLNQHFERVQAPIKINHFSSFFYVTYNQNQCPYGGLLFYLLREKGVHIWEYRPCFFTLAHSDQDIEWVMRAFKDSVAELQVAGFLTGVGTDGVSVNGPGGSKDEGTDRNSPPQPGARLGRDPQGNPAWYIPDPARSGSYLQVGAAS